jgi:hypothetical protein
VRHAFTSQYLECYRQKFDLQWPACLLRVMRVWELKTTSPVIIFAYGE